MLCRVFAQDTIHKLEALENVNKVILYTKITHHMSIGFKSSDKHMLRISKKDSESVEFNLFHYDETNTVYRTDTFFMPVLTEEDLEKVIKFVDKIK